MWLCAVTREKIYFSWGRGEVEGFMTRLTMMIGILFLWQFYKVSILEICSMVYTGKCESGRFLFCGADVCF